MDQPKAPRKEYSSSFHTFAAVWAVLWEYATPEQPLSAQAVWDLLQQQNHTPDRLPSPSTIGKLLRSSSGSFSHSAFFQLRCMARVEGRLIPYDSWEEQVEGRSNRTRLYYLEKPLSPGEWRLFSDLVRSSPFLSSAQTGRLMGALRHFDPCLSSTPPPRQEGLGLRDFLTVLNRLDRAIREHRLIRLTYGAWQLEQQDQGWQPRLRPLPSGLTGHLRPYTLFWSGGFYYLAASDGTRTLFLRTDRICLVELLEDTFSPPRDLDPEALAHGDCLSGGEITARLRCPLSLVGTVMDRFGSRPVYSTPREGRVDFALRAAPEAIRRFALEHCDTVELLHPESLRRELAAVFHRAERRYQP